MFKFYFCIVWLLGSLKLLLGSLLWLNYETMKQQDALKAPLCWIMIPLGTINLLYSRSRYFNKKQKCHLYSGAIWNVKGLHLGILISVLILHSLLGTPVQSNSFKHTSARKKTTIYYFHLILGVVQIYWLLAMYINMYVNWDSTFSLRFYVFFYSHRVSQFFHANMPFFFANMTFGSDETIHAQY